MNNTKAARFLLDPVTDTKLYTISTALQIAIQCLLPLILEFITMGMAF